MSEQRITATILSVTQEGTSRYGSPQYRVTTDKGSWLTMNDHNFAYGMRNYAPRVSDGIYCTVTLTLRTPRKYTYIVNVEGDDMMTLRDKRLA